MPLEHSKTHLRFDIGGFIASPKSFLMSDESDRLEAIIISCLDTSPLFEKAHQMMSPSERRKLRRAARRATLRGVASAPSFKSVKKKSSRRSPLRRAMILAAGLAILIGVTLAAPKAVHAAGPPPDAPEIDPGSIAGAMTLLVGGVLVLTDRARRC